MTASTGGGINIGETGTYIEHFYSFSEEYRLVLLAEWKSTI